MARGLPITLTRLEEKSCVVVGGGAVAERKVHSLLEAGARPRVIAPRLTDALTSLAQVGRIEWLARDYAPGDLAAAFLVVAATDDRQTNRAIASEAARQHALFNVVDDSEACNFIAPAVMRRGDLTIAIGTGGGAPALAGHLRAQMEQAFGPEWERYLELLERLRPQIAERYPDLRERQQAWARIWKVNLLELVREGDEQRVQAALKQALSDPQTRT